MKIKVAFSRLSSYIKVMKIKDLILELQKQDPESQIEFVGFIEYGFQEYMEVVSEECLIQEDSGFVQLIISGESLK